MNFLNAGVPVIILEMKQEALDRGIATIRKNYEAQVKKGKLKQDKYEQRMALLSTTLSYDDLKDCDLVIEAVFEELGVKEAVFKQLDAVCKRRSGPPGDIYELENDRQGKHGRIMRQNQNQMEDRPWPPTPTAALLPPNTPRWPTRSARWRWTRCNRPTPATPAPRWAWPRWPRRCGAAT